MEITINDKVYKSIDDLRNKFTLQQLKIAKPIITELISALPSKLISKMSKIRVLGEGEEYTPEELSMIEETTSEYNATLFKLITDWNKDAEILALLFLDEGEERFNKQTYLERVKLFEDNILMSDVERCGELMKDFFPTIVKFMQVNFLTSFLRGTGVQSEPIQQP